MGKPLGSGNLIPSVERRRNYVKTLQRKADEGDPAAIANYLMLNHVGALGNLKPSRK